MENNIYTIKEIDNFNYKLYSLAQNKEININLEFQIKEKVEVNDKIYIPEQYFDRRYKEYSHSYTFGYVNDITGRDMTDENKKYLVVLIKNENKIFLKRLFG